MNPHGIRLDRAPTTAFVGRATVDYLYVLEAYPREDTENNIVRQDVVVGGNAGRGAVVAGRLGGEARLLGMCGDDVHAGVLRQQLAAEPVDVTLVAAGGPSQHSCVIVAADRGTRTTIAIPQPRAGHDLLEAVGDGVRGADAVLLDWTDPVLGHAAVEACRRHGIPTVVDACDHQPDSEHLFAGTDYIIAPRDYFSARSPGAGIEEALRLAYDELKPKVIAATCGEQGGLYLDEDGLRRYEPFVVATVDSCGAGDTFHGAFTWAVAAGCGVDLAFRIASWAAARQCTMLGNAGLPDGAALRGFLADG